MNSVHSSFSHDLSPPFLFPHSSVLIPFFSSLSLFCSTFIPIPSSQYPYFSTFIPVTISIPLIFPFIPHTSPFLSLTFSYSPSSIRSSLTIHSSLFSYLFSSSLIHHPLSLSLSLFGCITQKRGWGKNWLVGQIRIWNVKSRNTKILAEFLNSLVSFCSTTGKPTHLFRTKCASLDSV